MNFDFTPDARQRAAIVSDQQFPQALPMIVTQTRLTLTPLIAR